MSRVGGRGQSDRQKKFGGMMLKTLAAYNQALEFSRFGSELAAEARNNITRGNMLYKMLNQTPSDSFGIMAQTLMLDIALNLPDGQETNTDELKKQAVALAPKIQKEEDYEPVLAELKNALKISDKPVEPEKKEEEKPAEGAAPSADKKDDKKYLRRERRYQSYQRSFCVPDVAPEDINASYEKGILELKFPKKDPAEPEVRKIEVK